ncbi:MAG: ATP-dependent DNA helicase DinG [Candidatus Azotimanducaceae bacterium]
MRGSTDRGKVVLMDPRVRTKGYGRKFVKALPFSDGYQPEY